MSTRKDPFITGEYYHVFNRGIEKRNIFVDVLDVERFLESMRLFNSADPIGSLFELSFNKTEKLGGLTAKSKKLADFVAYCVNPNHYHFILRQLRDGGISELMKRLGGYTWYFNNRHKRVGSLFQGTFKSVYIDSNDYLLHLSSYVNLNDKTHQLGGLTAKLVRSSWDEYVGKSKGFCKKGVILNQFRNKKEYKKFAEDALKINLDRKRGDDFNDLFLDLD